MNLGAAVVLVAALAAVSFLLAQRRALLAVSGDASLLHSLPGHYGWYAALWCGVPGLLVVLIWLGYSHDAAGDDRHSPGVSGAARILPTFLAGETADGAETTDFTPLINRDKSFAERWGSARVTEGFISMFTLSNILLTYTN